jgi:ADP-heptose:LPS heptosyltransferase
MKHSILFVGENPKGFSGNSRMLSELLLRVNKEKYEVFAFTVKTTPVDVMEESLVGVKMIEGSEANGDVFCSVNLLQVIQSLTVDIIVFVGLDMWRYSLILPQLKELKKIKKFKWVSIFPYDLFYLKEDWLEYLAPVDFPCVYSEYGLSMLEDKVKNVRYFRPPLHEANSFLPLTAEAKNIAKKQLFGLDDDSFLFGFFGINQYRKDPQRLIYAFSKLLKDYESDRVGRRPVLYLHTEVCDGVYNLQQFMNDLKIKTGDVFIKNQSHIYTTEAMSNIYNAMDCYLATALQEGLNWTFIEAMLCGLPVIASDSTAHKELIDKDFVLPVKCDELCYIPVHVCNNPTWLYSFGCNVDDLVLQMKTAMQKGENFEARKASRKAGEKWMNEVSDINNLLEEVIISKEFIKEKTKEILFAQHSSAGDVLMSTQCFKGIKERHAGKKLVYMTQDIYQDIITNNPYVDEIVSWDESLLDAYDYVYNPHGEKILTGGWNNLDVTLYSMYPYFCKVKPDEMFIDEVRPEVFSEVEKMGDYIVVHTSGASDFRRYPHMDIVLSGLKMNSIQIGGRYDHPCSKVNFDLRGKLSFRETAYVMKRAKVAVVIDSFPAHLAGALGTPVVVLFGPAPARVTRPRAKEGKLICLEPDMLAVCKILSHCWGAPPPGKEICNAPCINTISPFYVINAVKKLLT